MRKSSAVISPFSSFARASSMRCGRNRLPTSSARDRGFGSLHGLNSHQILMRGGAGDAKIAFEHRGIGLQRVACRIMHDRAAFQYHNPIGQP